MSWRRVAVVYTILALLAGYLLVFERAPAPVANDTPGSPAGPSLLEADATAVSSVTFRKEGRVVRATRHDERWQTVEPAGVQVSPDLIEATIATLTGGQAAEKLADTSGTDLAAYGLDAPTATVEVAISQSTTPTVTVLIGGRNPTRTAVYARRSDQPSIFLVGLNLSYYIDLIFDAAKS